MLPQAQDLGGALTAALKGEPPGTHHMPSMYKPVVRFTDDACQVRGGKVHWEAPLSGAGIAQVAASVVGPTGFRRPDHNEKHVHLRPLRLARTVQMLC